MKNIIKLIVKESEIDQRVDVFINKQESSLSRTRIKNLILKEKLKINDSIITNPSKKLDIRDSIQLEIPEPKKASLKPYNYKLNIIYEDHDLLVIDKSAGISIHPGAGNYDNTIVNALISYGVENLSNIGDELRPGIVHRIDKDTSGLIVVAKNNISHEHLSSQFNKHTIKRIYQTLIWGKLRPQTGIIETLITRSSKNRQLMEVGFTKGKKAITNYKTLEIYQNLNLPKISLVECNLETGRTHQIRVHMNFKGNSILGDKSYGKSKKKFKKIDANIENKINNFNRQALHAKSLAFMHQKTNKEIFFEAKRPKDFDTLIKNLNKASL